MRLSIAAHGTTTRSLVISGNPRGCRLITMLTPTVTRRTHGVHGRTVTGVRDGLRGEIGMPSVNLIVSSRTARTTTRAV